MISLSSLGQLGQRKLNFLRLVKRSPALQACNRTRNSQADGVPRGTRLRRSNQASGVVVFACPPLGGQSSCLENASASLGNASRSSVTLPLPWNSSVVPSLSRVPVRVVTLLLLAFGSPKPIVADRCPQKW